MNRFECTCIRRRSCAETLRCLVLRHTLLLFAHLGHFQNNMIGQFYLFILFYFIYLKTSENIQYNVKTKIKILIVYETPRRSQGIKNAANMTSPRIGPVDWPKYFCIFRFAHPVLLLFSYPLFSTLQYCPAFSRLAISTVPCRFMDV